MPKNFWGDSTDGKRLSAGWVRLWESSDCWKKGRRLQNQQNLSHGYWIAHREKQRAHTGPFKAGLPSLSLGEWLRYKHHCVLTFQSHTKCPSHSLLTCPKKNSTQEKAQQNCYRWGAKRKHERKQYTPNSWKKLGGRMDTGHDKHSLLQTLFLQEDTEENWQTRKCLRKHQKGGNGNKEKTTGT